MDHSLRLRLISGFSMALLLMTPVVSSASSNEVQMLKKQMIKAIKVADALQSFRDQACTYVDESAPSKKEITKCKREVNRIFLKVRVPLRGLPADEIDGIDDFVAAAQDCKRNVCENVPDAIHTLVESIGSVDDEESFVGSLQVSIDELESQEDFGDADEDSIIDPLFDRGSKSAKDGTKIIDPLFKPTRDGTGIIDPLFKPARDSSDIIDPLFKPTRDGSSIIDPLFRPTTSTSPSSSVTR